MVIEKCAKITRTHTGSFWVGRSQRDVIGRRTKTEVLEAISCVELLSSGN